MSIRSNVLKVKQKMFSEIDQPNKVFCKEVQQKALAAIQAGRESEAWRTYMTLFADADHPEQLARLLGKDNTADDPVKNEQRAYLVADGTCTTETVVNFGRNASEALDDGLEPV